MKYVVCLIITLISSLSVFSQPPEWPSFTSETKPWSRWWWPGSIVNPTDLTTVMEQYSRAGLGGLELTVLYGVKGYESKFIDFLSPDWMKMFEHTLKEAKRLDMGIDLANAASWPFGGPWVESDDASRYVAFKTYVLNQGEQLNEKIEYIQEPFIRWNSPFRAEINAIADPISKNPNLQQLAIDQIRFEKPIPLKALMAYSGDGKVIDVTGNVDGEGKLSWSAPAGKWTLYALFAGWHGKMVERAGPGGEGYVIDHFSGKAISNYLRRFDEAFKGYELSYLRGFFNDSYEVDDARGQSDWTLTMFDEFHRRRGYNLKEHLPALFQKDQPEKNERVLHDYRQTVSDLILDNFTHGWNNWAQKKGKLTRNQAHGSPGNILDLYAATDIPETEGTEIFRFKFGTSAANVTGKKLASAEAATWLDEHFSSNLADIKKSSDLYFAAGVNHIVYHGTCYSPPDDPWPGFHFYASVELNPSNPVWADFNALNTYITRVQSFMQSGQPDNDILLYFPASDTYSSFNKLMLEHFDGTGQRFRDTYFRKAADEMNTLGYTYDFISDLQLQNCSVNNGGVFTEGGSSYKAILVPQCTYIPVETFNRLSNLAASGATVIFYGNLPSDVSGYADFEVKRDILNHLKNQFKWEVSGSEGVKTALTGNGRSFSGNNLERLLGEAKIRREALADNGLLFCRRKMSDGTTYFIFNNSEKPFKGGVALETRSRSAAIFNPMTGEKGRAPGLKVKGEKTELYLELKPFETMIVKTYASRISGPDYMFFEPSGGTVALTGQWKLEFREGGPVLPAPVSFNEPALWTSIEGEEYGNFSGTAVYSVNFARPAGKSKFYSLNINKVHESARIDLNGKYLGTLIGPEFNILIPAGKLLKNNSLEIRVANLAANRIAFMDRKQVDWKKFYNTNFPSRLPQNRKNGLFDASDWPVRPSGLNGPVVITPVRMVIP